MGSPACGGADARRSITHPNVHSPRERSGGDEKPGGARDDLSQVNRAASGFLAVCQKVTIPSGFRPARDQRSNGLGKLDLGGGPVKRPSGS